MPHLFPFLQGTWHLQRIITDRRTLRTLTADGSARWALEEQGPTADIDGAASAPGAAADSSRAAVSPTLAYCEECAVHGLGAAAVPARASYIYASVCGVPSAAAVAFADGRPFHTLDLATGDSGPLAHACAPDDYAGRVIATGADALTIEWRVTGPAKDYTAVTHLRRAR